MRRLYLALGLLSLGLGAIGAFLPLLPTVPFLLLAAFFFARGNPAWEKRLLDDPRMAGAARHRAAGENPRSGLAGGGRGADLLDARRALLLDFAGGSGDHGKLDRDAS